MKVKDGICGLVVGDALGVPVEFCRRETLEADPVKGMRGYGTYQQPPGTWSDDTSMTLATMHSIIKKQKIDYKDMMDRFCDWLFEDKYCQEHVFDHGITTYEGIRRYKIGVNPIKCGGRDERSNGNGSLMRILPLAYIPNIDYETVENISSLTHGHKRSGIACALYVEIARSMLENDLTINEHINNSCAKIQNYYDDNDELKHFQRIFDDSLSDDNVSNKGYVISTLEVVLHCLKTTGNYRDAVLKAVNFGGDTDTNAAICGGLAGIYYGFDEIPIGWIEKIRKIGKVIKLCERYEGVIDEYF